jgi:hypothetical protein
MTFVSRYAFTFAAIAALAPAAQAAGVGYYVGRDNTALTGGNPNPNHERLTLLFNHGNHFHSIGRVGAATGELPESYIGGAITLFNGTGANAGRFVSQAYQSDTDPASEFSDLRFSSIHNLDGFDPGSEEFILYNSSGQRWNTLGLDDALVALEVVSMSAGLSAFVSTDSAIASSAGDRLVLGDGNSFLSSLTFLTDLGLAHNTALSATFRLVDLSTGGSPYGGSGEFRFSLATVPEPGSIAMAGLGLAGAAGLALARSRRRRVLAIA